MSKFTPYEDEILIEFVHNHSILYNVKDAEYKNTSKKDLAWNEVGKLLQKEGNECKKRWKSMRDHVKRGKKEEKGTTGKAAKKKRAVYWERLQFLDEAEAERSSFTNVLTPSDVDEASASVAQPDTEDLQEYEKDSLPEQLPHPSLQQRSPQLTQATSQNSRNFTRSPHGSAAFRPPASKTGKERAAFQKYSDERKEDRVHFEDLTRRSLPRENENEIDLFFKTMAATVKKFRPELATETKARVFKIVTEMEFLNLQPSCPRTPAFTNIDCNEN